MDRFFLNLKMLRLAARLCEPPSGHCILNFYNSVRLHSKRGNLPPNAFEQHLAIKLPIGECE